MYGPIYAALAIAMSHRKSYSHVTWWAHEPSEPPPPEYFEYLKEHSTAYFYPGGVSTRMVSGFKQESTDGTHH